MCVRLVKERDRESGGEPGTKKERGGHGGEDLYPRWTSDPPVTSDCTLSCVVSFVWMKAGKQSAQ